MTMRDTLPSPVAQTAAMPVKFDFPAFTPGPQGFHLNIPALVSEIAKCDTTGLDYSVGHWDSINKDQQDVEVCVHGMIPTHIVGRDEDGDPEWNYEPVKAEYYIRVNHQCTISDLASWVALRLLEARSSAVSAHYEGQAVYETNRMLEADYNRTR